MKIKKANISFIEYVSLKDRSEYDYLLKYGGLKADDYFNLGDFLNLEFGFIKDMQEHLNYTGLDWQTYLEEISKHTRKDLKKLANIGIFDLYQSRLYLRQEIERITKLESSNLGHKASIEEEQAGIEVFDKYRSFLQFDHLTKGNIIKINDIRKIKYSICFTKLMLDADRSEFDNKLFNIRNKKKK